MEQLKPVGIDTTQRNPGAIKDIDWRTTPYLFPFGNEQSEHLVQMELTGSDDAGAPLRKNYGLSCDSF